MCNAPSDIDVDFFFFFFRAVSAVESAACFVENEGCVDGSISRQHTLRSVEKIRDSDNRGYCWILDDWFAFFEGVKGIRLWAGSEFAGSPLLVFPARDGAPFSNQAFNGRIKLATEES